MNYLSSEKQIKYDNDDKQIKYDNDNDIESQYYSALDLQEKVDTFAFDVVNIDEPYRQNFKKSYFENDIIFHGDFADTFMDDDIDDNNVGMDIDILRAHDIVLSPHKIDTCEYGNYMHKQLFSKSLQIAI
jgi:hypothetical protein